MGLKNTNYKIGHNTYDTVYAVFNGNIKKLGNEYVVGFNIDTKREFALSDEPLVKKEVKVKVEDWDRKTDLVALAYQKGKEKVKHTYYDPITHEEKEVFIDGVFTGWVDDDIHK